ncbi:mitochondrial distribution and morphology [Malassezia nana]|uniref:Mitochondrial distribution and morphology n=1 Tax=Malassezia nana TaxID=180528 RepID=A0AAF0EQI8_9BASI|nr:mitochondrial distribution and morphology [Malassezia nana]
MGTAKGNVLDQYRCIDVYNAIESRNYPLAVKKADSLLQAGPFPLASALKALALFRLGRKDQAAEETEKVLSQKVDLNVIMPLDVVLPQLGRAQQLADLYLAASQAHPDDEELAEGTLLCLVKNHMYQRALQLLLKRFRVHKDKKDFWRYIQVAILHSQRLQPPGSKLALEVAYRLFKEQELDDTSFSEDVLSLYLSFFLIQGKDRLQEALQVLEQPHCKSLANNSLTIQFQLRECWKVLGDNKSLLNDCRSRIAQGDRNWAVISECINTMGLLASKSMDQDDVDLIIKAAEQDRWEDRGSFLGVLELFRVSHDRHLEKPSGLNYAELVRKYLETFLSKPSCFDDVRPFLAHFPDADRESLMAWVHDVPDLSTESNIVRKVNAAKITRFFQTDLDSAKATCLSLLHDYSQSFEHVHVPDTEMHPGDDLALLAAMEACTGPEALNTAAVIALHGCDKSNRAYRLRLFLIRLLLRLGCLKLALEHFEALGLKAVQFDTVSHYMMDRNSSFGGSHAADIANQWESHMQHFYSHSAYEVPEALGRAFSNGKFSQVSDLCEFNDCLAHSCAKVILELDMVRSKFVNQDLVDSEYASAQGIVQKIIDLVNGMLELLMISRPHQ